MTSITLLHAVPLARRQLLAHRGRTFAAVVGVAMALLLVLALRAIFAGMEDRLTAYIDGTGADVVVAQQGVRTMHMTQSALPPTVVSAIGRIPGVARADGIVYRGAFLESSSGRRAVVAVVAGGTVRRVVSGRAPREGEIAIDRVAADTLGAGIGSTVRVLGMPLRVSGEVNGTAAISGSFAFVDARTLARMLNLSSVFSYVLVRGQRRISPAVLAARIELRLPGVTATARSAFAASERRVVGDMSTGIVRGMTLVAFVIGVAVAGLVAYAQALSQLRDYGVLRAIGLSGRRAIAIAVTQVAAVVAGGLVIALGLLWALTIMLPAASPTLVLAVRTGDVVEAAGFAVVVALAAAVVPILRVVRVEPASVFRGAS